MQANKDSVKSDGIARTTMKKQGLWASMREIFTAMHAWYRASSSNLLCLLEKNIPQQSPIMRVVKAHQMTLGEVDISQIQFDLKSRDDIPRILRGLQHLYMNEPLRKTVFELLEQEFQPNVSKQVGRPGMTLWTILVLGVIRLDLNADYDRVLELANQHNTLRQMLGHSDYDNPQYQYQTLVDNIRLFTPELLDKLNTLVVKEGHVLVKKGDAALRGRCDSFVVETNVHYPTDISLLLDAMRKAIVLVAHWCEEAGRTEWRQYRYNINHLKRLVRTTQQRKQRKKDTTDQPGAVQQAHQELLNATRDYLNKLQHSEAELMRLHPNPALQQALHGWIAHALRQIDQTERRVIKGEVIPHDEKVFSLFEPHTEWVSKGKAGVPVELGVKVCVMEDQYRFILQHRVMQQETDDKVAVSMVKDSQAKFPDLKAASFDKGFHSPNNQTELAELLQQVTLPRKGKLSQVAREHQQAEAFRQARRQHSAVESAINALEVHGLDVCPDHGIEGFKRYVAFAVLTRNLHRLGDLVWQQDQAREQRRQAAKQGHQKRRQAA